jgi:heme-degrading monooxygenase HmoA
MSVVKINAISVPEGAGPELEARFAARLGAVENMPGFEGFELLRPISGEDRYFVYTRWTTEADFQNWRNSQQFQHGHGSDTESAPRPPVGTGSALLEFEVVERV